MNIILYSKFSPYSQNLIKYIQKYKFIINNFNFVCIDNKQIRDKINNCNKINISKIPCLIIIFEKEGGVEIYEGPIAFDKIKNIIEEEYSIEFKQQEQQEMLQKQETEQKLQQKKEESKQKLQKKSVKKQQINKTNIEDLKEDESYDEEDESYEEKENNKQPSIKKRPAVLRSNEGEYDLEDNFGDDVYEQNRESHTGIKHNNEDGTSSNIMSLAMEMQKNRERDNPPIDPKTQFNNRGLK